ncbi:unnamed protein product [Allacma fusca]|uniref:SUEL-type lectin domain-containing protein n=1 Tax=Allacma fusca TaxID=39272 RepID=A0A8J2NKJ8_9HEXA|nr:unnamed protein product [Allacma fusca]
MKSPLSLQNFFWIILISTLTSGDNLALLSGTLRTYQRASCDEEWMSLRCPTGTTISVQLAQYGRNSRLPSLCQSSPSHSDLQSHSESSNVTCQWPAAMQTVVGYCQRKSNCKFQTSPQTFGGDPCPGIRKYVEVAYKCRPSEFKSVIGCEDEVIQLKCNWSSRLAIYSANYGRTEYESVQCPQPNGVPEESCLSSFATETVMQICHGKRQCALSADPTTFGSPCKPESRMYLKVIHTCVPRKVLQDKYQGSLDPDEMNEMDEFEDDEDSSVIEQPSIYSPDHSKGWGGKNGTNPGRNTLQGPYVEPSSEDEDLTGARDESHSQFSSSHDSHTGNGSSGGGTDNNPVSHAGVRIVYLVSQGINAYDFITRNPEKFYLYLAISTASALLLLVLLIIVKTVIQRRKRRRRENNSGLKLKTKPSSSSSAGPIFSSGLSDIDDLSLDLDQNDISFTELPSILKRSSPYDREHAESRREARSPTSFTGTFGTNTLSRSNEVVRFSNTLGRKGRDTNNPRSLKQDGENEHFFYG